MFIKTEDGDMVEVTRMDEEDNIIDLTLDEDEESNEISKTTDNVGKSKAAETSDKSDKIDEKGDNNGKDVDSNRTEENVRNSAGAADETSDSKKENEETEKSKTDSSKSEANTSLAGETTSLAGQTTSAGEQLDIKPDKALLDKKIKEKEVATTNRGSQTVPVVMKLVSLEEAELLKLSAVEKNAMLLSNTRELEEAKGNLTSLQENIYRLLKIIVPDYDYGEPGNVEKVILEFIRVNEEESQEASGS